ncbi:hypothetical protein C8Q72DRAFT_358138 [Fomitopsis betulina]|nr:hypothetical protein C8Q72DRAFT_358138 [Fomitopsis betulina]
MPSTTSGLRSPSNPRAGAASPRPTFDAELLKAYMKKLLQTTLQNATWPEQKDHERVKAWNKEIGERVKERAIEIQPRGFKYIVMTQIHENLGQGGRADMACHWEDSDAAAREMFVNNSIVCTCVAFAIRTI